MSLLSIQDLGKAFRTYRSEWHRFANWFGLTIKPNSEHWIIRHVNIDIQPGEAIGIIGKNGAGKSTLLKILTGTLQPTEGRVLTNGSIAAILELGMGFNPELSGRQNAFHSAGLMGFSTKQIHNAIQNIESFADIGEYFDEPVRTYSSGMQARVAFAVATAFRPDILIVDEVLSVGDAAFQRKCFRRIEAFQKKGTTLLLVSHDTETVKKLCDKAMFIKNGKVVDFGSTKIVCDEYEKYIFGGKDITTTEEETSTRGIYDNKLKSSSGITYGDGRATITDVWFENISGNKINTIECGKNFCINYIVETHQDLKDIIFSIMIKTREGIAVYGTDTMLTKHTLTSHDSNTKVQVAFQLSNYLAPGIYYLNCGVRDDSQEESIFVCRLIDTEIFKVTPSKINTIGPGLVELQSQAHVKNITSDN